MSELSHINLVILHNADEEVGKRTLVEGDYVWPLEELKEENKISGFTVSDCQPASMEDSEIIAATEAAGLILIDTPGRDKFLRPTAIWNFSG